MRLTDRLLLAILVAPLLGACASDPNAYKKHGGDFGYTGHFLEESSQGNLGGVTFTGDETISPTRLRQYCMRRIA
jgi:hypothetical protein